MVPLPASISNLEASYPAEDAEEVGSPPIPGDRRMTWGGGERAGAAVVIGVGEYLHAESVRPLRFAAPDAEAVSRALIDPAICGFPAGKVKLLTDAEACRDAMAHHLSKWLPAQAKGAEIVVIYFAGHGAVHAAGRREEGYLLAHDADPEDLATRGILMTDLARWVEAIDARAVVVCVDCCHAAKLIARGDSPGEAATRDMTIRPAMLQALAGRGRYLIASCDEGQVSVEADRWGHGLFTHHLLDGLRGAGDRDGDGRVGVAEFFEHVSEAVERDARTMGLVQKPWISSVGSGGVYVSVPNRNGDDRDGSVARSPLRATAERLWSTQGSAAAIREIEGSMEGARAEELLAALDLLGIMKDPAGVPLLFRCLAHPSESIRERARQVIVALGWDRVTATIEDVARRGIEEQVVPILDGMAAFEAHREIVGLLDRLSSLLKDNLRNRAIRLLERKQQGLEFERVAALFRESRSHFKILKPLGQGLYTAAYLARDESIELDLVVRVLRPEYACWPQIRAQFLDLTRRSVKLVHHNLVLTREARDFPDRHIYYAVRDYVEGVTLQRMLESGRAFTAGQIIKLLRQILLALTPIHAGGMVHGSIKPSNVFVCGEDRVVLGDLALPPSGISLPLDRLSYDYRYAPPEMFRQAGVLGPWSDFYALGCLAYELACGAPPFVSDNHFELAGMHDREAARPPCGSGSALGPSGDALILRLLAKSPAERPADLVIALRELDDLAAALRTGVKELAPARPILGEASLIRYTTDDMISVLAFPVEPGSIGPARDPEDTMTTTTGPYEASGAGLLGPMPKALGRYSIIREIGSGGLGRVLLAQDQALRRQVAIKLSVGGSRIHPEALARFRMEAEAVARLDHQNIVRIFDVGQTEEFAYTVLEYVDGGDLRQRMDESSWPAESAARLVLTLARAVDYAHSAGILHRDLKPSNILLTKDGVPKISDFGLAKLIGDRDEAESSTLPGTVMGTPSYMAPEQAAGEIEDVGKATDVYALGTILYELLAGRRPFQGGTPFETLMQVRERRPDPPSRWRPGLSRELDAICLRCLEKSPRKRYATAGELADALERFVERSSTPPRPGFWERARGLLSFKKTHQDRDRPPA
jgi:serine/threonine protein kinase